MVYNFTTSAIYVGPIVINCDWIYNPKVFPIKTHFELVIFLTVPIVDN